MADLGMGLDAEDWLFLMRNSGKGRVSGRGDGAEAHGKLAQAITVGHVLASVSEIPARRGRGAPNAMGS